MACRCIPAAMVVDWRPGGKHYKPDEHTVFLPVFSRWRMVNRHLAQHVGELVCDERRRYGDISNWSAGREGHQDWSAAGQACCSGAVYAGPSGRLRTKME